MFWSRRAKRNTVTEVIATMNGVCDDVESRLDLEGTGKQDAMSLVLNATAYRLENPGATLEEVARALYTVTLETILGWVRDD